MKRRFIKLNNKGYSLVEMIIVIAIIAILTTAAFITLSVMNTAKAKEASITFDSELATLLGKSKGKACDANADGTISETELKNNSFGLRVYKSGGKTYLQTVVLNEDDIYVKVDAFEEKNNPNDGKGVSLSASIYIKYVPFTGTAYEIEGGAASIIAFSKSGDCIKGYGKYEFYRDNGDKIATVTINKNGSRISK